MQRQAYLDTKRRPAAVYRKEDKKTENTWIRTADHSQTRQICCLQNKRQKKTDILEYEPQTIHKPDTFAVVQKKKRTYLNTNRRPFTNQTKFAVVQKKTDILEHEPQPFKNQTNLLLYGEKKRTQWLTNAHNGRWTHTTSQNIYQAPGIAVAQGERNIKLTRHVVLMTNTYSNFTLLPSKQPAVNPQIYVPSQARHWIVCSDASR